MRLRFDTNFFSYIHRFMYLYLCVVESVVSYACVFDWACKSSLALAKIGRIDGGWRGESQVKVVAATKSIEARNQLNAIDYKKQQKNQRLCLQKPQDKRYTHTHTDTHVSMYVLLRRSKYRFPRTRVVSKPRKANICSLCYGWVCVLCVCACVCGCKWPAHVIVTKSARLYCDT